MEFRSTQLARVSAFASTFFSFCGPTLPDIWPEACLLTCLLIWLPVPAFCHLRLGGAVCSTPAQALTQESTLLARAAELVSLRLPRSPPWQVCFCCAVTFICPTVVRRRCWQVRTLSPVTSCAWHVFLCLAFWFKLFTLFTLFTLSLSLFFSLSLSLCIFSLSLFLSLSLSLFHSFALALSRSFALSLTQICGPRASRWTGHDRSLVPASKTGATIVAPLN